MKIMLNEKKQDKKTDFAFDETIKRMRTNIQLSGPDVKTVLMTSTSAQEGKSTLSWELAKSIAETEKKVCYIDADIRRSVFSSRHGIHKEVKGLSQVLSGIAGLEEALCETDIPNLSVILSGPFSPNPAELFAGNRCKELFEQLKEMDFDSIIVDTAPLGSVIDAAVLAKYTDGIVLVAEFGVTRKRYLAQVKAQIDRTGTRLLGIVLNKAEMGHNGYYYQQAYYY